MAVSKQADSMPVTSQDAPSGESGRSQHERKKAAAATAAAAAVAGAVVAVAGAAVAVVGAAVAGESVGDCYNVGSECSQ
jgi:hypothetical protein